MPHSYITANAVIDKIVSLRKELISKNQKVSINDFIIKASALALRVIYFVFFRKSNYLSFNY